MQDKEHHSEEFPELAPKVSLMQKLRLPLMIGGGVLAAIVFLLIGIGIGSAKRNADIKGYEERIANMKKRVETSSSEQKILEAKLEGLTSGMKGYKESEESRNALLASLQQKLACFELAASQALAAEQVALQSGAAKRTKPGEPATPGYVRFGNSSCTLVAGGGGEGWKECLKQGKSVGGAKPKDPTSDKNGAKATDAVKGSAH